MFANANRGKNSPPAKLNDFLPFRRAVVPDDDDVDSQILKGNW